MTETNDTQKVLWFSRHEMTDDQRDALGPNVEIEQVNKSINSAYELQDEIARNDVIAIVAPINLQQQFLKLAGDKPVIMAVNDRVLVPQQDGTEDKVIFQFNKWEQLDNIEIAKHDYEPEIPESETQKVLWVSRHEMTDDQLAALGPNVELEQVNKTLNSAYELQDEIARNDVIAIVAPINLQQQFLKLAGDKPVIMAVNDRVLVPQQDGTEDKVIFQFNKWEQLDEINVMKHDYEPEPVREQKFAEHGIDMKEYEPEQLDTLEGLIDAGISRDALDEIADPSASAEEMQRKGEFEINLHKISEENIEAPSGDDISDGRDER